MIPLNTVVVNGLFKCGSVGPSGFGDVRGLLTVDIIPAKCYDSSTVGRELYVI